MDPRANFQRFFEDMDAISRRKQQEIDELNEQLVALREQVSEEEAKRLLSQQEATNVAPSEGNLAQQDIDQLMQRQRAHYQQQIANLNHELTELELANRGLAKSNGQLAFEVDALKVSNEKLKARMQGLNESLEEVQSANFELNIRLAKAESESQMQQKLLRKSHEQDQILMDAFNNKLDSLRRAIAVRDDEIRRLHGDSQMVLESLGIEIDPGDKGGEDANDQLVGREKLSSSYPAFAGTIDLGNNHDKDWTRKHPLVQVVNLIRERDAQIEELTNQLVQASHQTANTSVKINSHIESDLRNLVVPDRHEAQSNGCDDKSEALIARCRMLEDELSEKDKHLHLIAKRNRHVEKILPGELVEMVENLHAICAPMLKHDGKGLDDRREMERNFATLTRLAENLNVLLSKIGSTQTLLDTVDRLQRLVLSRDRHIKRLVRELNARINQDALDAPPVVADELDSPHSTNEFVCQPSLREDEPVSSRSEGQLTVTGEAEDEDPASPRERESRASEGQPREGEIESKVNAMEATPSSGQKQGTHPQQFIESFLTIISRDRIKSSYAKVGAGKAERGLLGRHRHARGKRPVQVRAKFTMDFRGRKKTALALRPIRPSHDIDHAHHQTEQDGQQQPQQEFNYRNRLGRLESENQLLELAMKEILMSIKWSDTRSSTILIDCPSLERLCQQIEARYIANGGSRIDFTRTGEGSSAQQSAANALQQPSEPSRGDETRPDSHLFQFVVLKSELDSLRGQNEQLRSDLRLQQREWQSPPRLRKSEDEQVQTWDREEGRQQQQQTDGERGGEKLEAECQTDSLILIDPRQLMRGPQPTARVDGPNEGRVQALTTIKGEGKCRNCSRLVSLANHLLDCIVRIESRVNSSDESYINRLLTLYQLSQQLGQDLSMRDNIINHLRRESHRASHHTAVIESRLRSLEAYLEVHNKACPLRMQTKSSHCRDTASEDQDKKSSASNVRWHSATTNDSNQSVHSLTIRSNQRLVEVPLKDSRIAISLLQSIIACLQARLDYKDERLNQLEQLLVAS